MTAIDVSAYVDNLEGRLVSYEVIAELFPHAKFVNLWGHGSEIHATLPGGRKLAINTYRASYAIDIIDDDNSYIDSVGTHAYTNDSDFREVLARAKAIAEFQ